MEAPLFVAEEILAQEGQTLEEGGATPPEMPEGPDPDPRS